MRGQNSRGAKFSITSMADLLKILVLEKDVDFHILIAQAAEEFERGNEKYERTRIVKTPQKIKEHIEKEILSDKSLGSIICYIFSSEEKSDVILEKMVNLFKIISIEEKRSHREKLNDLISKNIERKNSIIANTEIFSPEVNIFINQNWKINVEFDEQIITGKENLNEYGIVESDAVEFKSTNETNKKEEILNEIEKKGKKKRSFRWAYILILIFGFLFVLFLVLSDLGNKLIAPLEEIMVENIKGAFNPDPSGNNIGFLSINLPGVNLANQKDSLQIPEITKGDAFIFSVYLDFHNYGVSDIKNVKAKITSVLIEDTLFFTGTLSGDDVKSIYDTTALIGLKEGYNVYYIDGQIENTHGNSPNCPGYGYVFLVSEEEIMNGVNLDVLDAQTGFCDQGYLIGTFQLTKE
jgi:hypothetical protein